MQIHIAQNRLALVGVIAVAGALTGAFLTSLLGQNFATGSISLPGIGTLHRPSLPETILNLEELYSIEVKANGADDNMRIYFNNYLILSDEGPNKLFPFLKPDDHEIRKFVKQYTMDRNPGHYGLRRADFYKKRGWNHLILEVGNSRAGFCVGLVDVKINGKSLERFPRILPNSPSDVAKLYPASVVRAKPGRYFLNGLCDRQIYQFYLD